MSIKLPFLSSKDRKDVALQLSHGSCLAVTIVMDEVVEI